MLTTAYRTFRKRQLTKEKNVYILGSYFFDILEVEDKKDSDNEKEGNKSEVMDEKGAKPTDAIDAATVQNSNNPKLTEGEEKILRRLTKMNAQARHKVRLPQMTLVKWKT